MELVKITDLTNELDVSSRTLRYYEQAGLIESIRPEYEKYRFYDEHNVERLRQIIVLRKMQIPVKDIIRIYENEDTATIVDVFYNRIREIEEQENTLAELKRITSDFLHTMTEKGITKISALPLLYAEIDKELTTTTVSMSQLNTVSRKITAKIETPIIYLPQMRLLTSVKNGVSDVVEFNRFLELSGISNGISGQHNHCDRRDRHDRFEYQNEKGDIIAVRVDDDFCNNSSFEEIDFTGGLFAVSNVYLDEDLGERFRTIINSFDDNNFYEIDYTHDGTLRHPTMLENLISPDDRRELVAMFVPVKKRLANPNLFDKPQEVKGITVAEIEAAEQVLWEKKAELDKLSIVRPNGGYVRYELLEDGEAIFSTYVGSRYLSTNIEVKLPFRVDFTYKFDKSPPNADEGIRLNFGNNDFSVNEENNPDPALSKHTIRFGQPVFGNGYNYPHIGAVKKGEFNMVTWIIGHKYLAVIINDELRLCLENMPYMKLDEQTAYPVMFNGGGDVAITVKDIIVSQLAQNNKIKIKEGTLTMVAKQSNNIIPIIHNLVADELGENYWFNGSARYVMECLGEQQYDYNFFAGISGDNFTQIYYGNNFRECDFTHMIVGNGNSKFLEDLFAKCGYASTAVSCEQLRSNKGMYVNTLMAYVDKGIPVAIDTGNLGGVIVGYEDYGKTLLLITGNSAEPRHQTFEEVSESAGNRAFACWVFVGEKLRDIPLANIYRDAVKAIPEILTTKHDDFSCGAQAFRDWADEIESGRYDIITPEEFGDSSWWYYTNYVCILATNGGGAQSFLNKALDLNPDLTFIPQVNAQYQRMSDMWMNDPDCLEKLGGGFNITLETLQDKEKRTKIAAKIREFAVCADEIVKIMKGQYIKC